MSMEADQSHVADVCAEIKAYTASNGNGQLPEAETDDLSVDYPAAHETVAEFAERIGGAVVEHAKTNGKPPRPADARITPDLIENIPPELRERKICVVWRWVFSREKNKYDKPPVCPYTGHDIDATDPANWMMLEDARAATEKNRALSGVGIALGAKDNRVGIVGIDLDNCLDEWDQPNEEAAKIVRDLNSYTERTPSGKGLRVLIWGDKPGAKCRTSKRPGIEIYEHERYLTVTGRHLEKTPTAIARRQAELEALYFETFPDEKQPAASKPDPLEQTVRLTATTDDEIVEKARQNEKNGTAFSALFDQGDTSAHAGDDSAADLALCNYLAFWFNKDAARMERAFSASALGQREKWKNREDYRKATIDAAIAGLSGEGYNPQANGKAKKAAGNPKKPRGSSVSPSVSLAANLTEWGNAKRLIRDHGQNLRYSKSLGWFEWDGCRWKPDQTGAIWARAKDTVRQLGMEAANTVDDKQRQATLRWALDSEQKKIMSAMIELAWSEPGVSILPDQLDADPWALNTPSGTVDLKTGALRPHQQSDLISKITSVPYDPKADCPRWKNTLSEIFANDPIMVAYLQRALGYSISGFIGEHALFLCHGTGRNGKNTVLDTVGTILRDYATIANPRTFLTIGQNDHLAMIADLMGRRFVPTDEVEEGEQLAESMVKRLTGNKTLKARFMHKNPFEFPVLFKVWMLANCKPEIQGQDEGIWSRIRLIPFEVYFPPEKRIKGLSDILIAEEGPGILRWLVDGCLLWQKHGLAEPEKVKNAIREYRSEQNVLMDFISQCCDSFLHNETLREQVRVNFSDLYGRYAAWCKENGEKKVLTARKFGLKLTPLGYRPHDSNGKTVRLGLKLKDRPKTTSGADDQGKASVV
jgi:putative DNA primase/helicase